MQLGVSVWLLQRYWSIADNTLACAVAKNAQILTWLTVNHYSRCYCSSKEPTRCISLTQYAQHQDFSIYIKGDSMCRTQGQSKTAFS